MAKKKTRRTLLVLVGEVKIEGSLRRILRKVMELLGKSGNSNSPEDQTEIKSQESGKR